MSSTVVWLLLNQWSWEIYTEKTKAISAHPALDSIDGDKDRYEPLLFVVEVEVAVEGNGGLVTVAVPVWAPWVAVAINDES